VVAALLCEDRDQAARDLGCDISPDWPDAELLGVLSRQARMTVDEAAWRIWLIIDREDRLVVGDVTFLGPPSEHGTVGIAYGVVPSHRRRGYATEAARALIGWASQQQGVSAIAAACADDNQASIRTLQRVGFSQTGRKDRELRWRLSPPPAPS
jgi:RimJ/RimL family protein N-acetyltransferase